MIVMAADYVGYSIVNYLCERKEKIDVLVYDTANRGGYNAQMIELMKRVLPETEICSDKDLTRKDIFDSIRQRGIDLGILAWWPYIISPETIKLTKRGFINTHPGYLPYNRGKHPSFWSIVEGTPFGVTLHYVDQDIDHGPIIAQKEIPVTWLDTGESLSERAKEEMIALFRNNFEAIKDGTINAWPKAQSNGTFHYGKELEPFCEIDLDKEYTARDIFNILRGRMFRGKGASSFVDGTKRYYVSISIQENDEASINV